MPGKCINSSKTPVRGSNFIIQWKSIIIEFTFTVLNYLFNTYTSLSVTWGYNTLGHLATGVTFFFSFQHLSVFSSPFPFHCNLKHRVGSASQTQFLLLISLLSQIRALSFSGKNIKTWKNKDDEEIFLCLASTIILIASTSYFLTSHCHSLLSHMHSCVCTRPHLIPWMIYLIELYEPKLLISEDTF